MEEDEIYSGNGEKSVLTSLSDSYSELEAISVSTSGPSSYSTSHYLLATPTTTDYCSKEKVTDFGLRRLFYSKQDLKDTCCFLV